MIIFPHSTLATRLFPSKLVRILHADHKEVFASVSRVFRHFSRHYQYSTVAQHTHTRKKSLRVFRHFSTTLSIQCSSLTHIHQKEVVASASRVFRHFPTTLSILYSIPTHIYTCEDVGGRTQSAQAPGEIYRCFGVLISILLISYSELADFSIFSGGELHSRSHS